MREIKDYLPLYWGAKCKYCYKGKLNWHYGTIGSICIQRALAGNYETKPILRPLSDMNEDEAKDLGMLLYKGVIIGTPVKIFFWRVPYGIDQNDFWEIDGQVFNQHQTIYLLSKHFDLFGLIEAGLALDATTTPLTK